MGGKKVFKGKTVDVSKESIERGVKVRKRTERDHDGSDFVYPKQKKKSIQETIPQAKAQISDPDFDTTKKGNNQSKNRDLHESIIYKNLQPKNKHLSKKIDKATSV